MAEGSSYYLTDCHKIQWKGCTQAHKKPLDIVGNPDHVTFWLGLQLGGAKSYIRHWVLRGQVVHKTLGIVGPSHI